MAYCSREDVMGALDVKATSYESSRIDRAIATSSDNIDSLCQRKFYPSLGTRVLPVNREYPSRLWLGEDELLAVTAMTDDSTTYTTADYTLLPAYAGSAASYEKPHLSIDFDGAVPSGDDITITGTWGYCKNTRAVTTLAAEISASATTMTTATGESMGVGLTYQIGTEWVTVTERSFVTTTKTLAAVMTAAKLDQIITVTGISKGETILIGAEKMLVLETTATTIIVERAWDGSTLAAHSIADVIYGTRSFTIVRGVRGSTAAIQVISSVVSVVEPPNPVHQLAVGLALDNILQERAGYARTSGSGENERATRTQALLELRDVVVATYGRTVRTT